MKQPIRIISNYAFTYEVFEDKIAVRDKVGKVIINFIDDGECLEQAIFVFRMLKQELSSEKKEGKR